MKHPHGMPSQGLSADAMKNATEEEHKRARQLLHEDRAAYEEVVHGTDGLWVRQDRGDFKPKKQEGATASRTGKS